MQISHRKIYRRDTTARQHDRWDDSNNNNNNYNKSSRVLRVYIHIGNKILFTTTVVCAVYKSDGRGETPKTK